MKGVAAHIGNREYSGRAQGHSHSCQQFIGPQGLGENFEHVAERGGLLDQVLRSRTPRHQDDLTSRTEQFCRERKLDPRHAMQRNLGDDEVRSESGDESECLCRIVTRKCDVPGMLKDRYETVSHSLRTIHHQHKTSSCGHSRSALDCCKESTWVRWETGAPFNASTRSVRYPHLQTNGRCGARNSKYQ